MKNAWKIPVRNGVQGFSLLEMTFAVAILFTLLALVTPTLMTQVYNIRIRYSATNLSGILQRARMEAVRKNAFYSVQQTTLADNSTDVFVDIPKTGVVATSDPQVVLGNQVRVNFGAGSGAPGETAFIAGLNFTVAAAGAAPSFNARG